MVRNRSVPPSAVVPVLAYEDVARATTWLCEAFGFKVRLRIGDHRAQLTFGNGALIVIRGGRAGGDASEAVLVQVENADRHYEQAKKAGAQILDAPTDYPYGERQYTAEDVGGHQWTFSQSIADIDPASWGASSIDLE